MAECGRYTCRYGFKESIPQEDFGLIARADRDLVVGVCDHGEECCPHYVTGRFVEAGANAYSEDSPLVRQGDSCRTTCPHCGAGTAEGHSSACYVNGRPVHRVGDCVSLGGGCGVTVTSTSRARANS